MSRVTASGRRVWESVLLAHATGILSWSSILSRETDISTALCWEHFPSLVFGGIAGLTWE